MVINNIGIHQNGNLYTFYLENNKCIAQLVMPPDNQYAEDINHINVIAKELALRWGAIQKKRKG